MDPQSPAELQQALITGLTDKIINANFITKAAIGDKGVKTARAFVRTLKDSSGADQVVISQFMSLLFANYQQEP